MSKAGEQRFNIELKARLPNRERAIQTCERLGAHRVGVEQQTDTYFSMGSYRMKLRESSLGKHWIIWYHRPNDSESRKSTYRLFSVKDPEPKRRLLAGQMGVKVTVVKDRLLYLLGSVRIHIDRVEGLGDFLEFEAALDRENPEPAARAEVERLKREFLVNEEELISSSYSDLLLTAVPR